MANQSVAFDLFVRKGVDKLQSDVRGRSAAAQQLVQACKSLSGTPPNASASLAHRVRCSAIWRV